MNGIERLENLIPETEEIIQEHRSKLVEEPENIAHQISLKHMEVQLAELQSELRNEKELREKEVIEIHLEGAAVQNGTIPLHLLAEIADSVSGAVLSASQRIKVGEKARGRIPRDIIETLDLRLAGLSAGSTVITISGNTAPDLFGNSLLEDSLRHTFQLLQSESPDQIAEAASEMGIRAVKKFNSFFKTLISSDIEAEVSWSTPAEQKFVWKGEKEKILMMSNSLDSLERLPSETIEFTGEIIMLHKRGRFEIKDINDVTYRGVFPSQLLDAIVKLHIGEQCKGRIEKQIISYRTTGTQKAYYSLVSISQLD